MGESTNSNSYDGVGAWQIHNISEFHYNKYTGVPTAHSANASSVLCLVVLTGHCHPISEL
jgi:hypothetical protein